MTRAEQQTAGGPPWVDPTVRDALRPFVAWFGYEFDLSGVTARVIDLNGLDAPALGLLPAAVREGWEADGVDIAVLDLHGKRAAEARDLLDYIEGEVSVVYFGKGSGVLRSVFEQWVAAQAERRLVGLSGHTEDEDVPAVGVLMTHAAHSAVLERLQRPAGPPRAPRVAPRGSSRAPRRASVEAARAPLAASPAARASSRGDRAAERAEARRRLDTAASRRRVALLVFALMVVVSLIARWLWVPSNSVPVDAGSGVALPISPDREPPAPLDP